MTAKRGVPLYGDSKWSTASGLNLQWCRLCGIYKNRVKTHGKAHAKRGEAVFSEYRYRWEIVGNRVVTDLPAPTPEGGR
jgi:hypothetical protein